MNILQKSFKLAQKNIRFLSIIPKNKFTPKQEKLTKEGEEIRKVFFIILFKLY